jgi:hypothetical protein
MPAPLGRKGGRTLGEYCADERYHMAGFLCCYRFFGAGG